MHEMSLAGGVLRLGEQACARDPFGRVSRLTLQAGALAGVEVPALRFALDAIAPGTLLEGAEVHIDEPPAQALCPGCGQTVAIASRLDDCPLCGAAGLQPTGGTELKLGELVVGD